MMLFDITFSDKHTSWQFSLSVWKHSNCIYITGDTLEQLVKNEGKNNRLTFKIASYNVISSLTDSAAKRKEQRDSVGNNG